MPALVAGIHVFLGRSQGVDGRDKPGHDESKPYSAASADLAGRFFNNSRAITIFCTSVAPS